MRQREGVIADAVKLSPSDPEKVEELYSELLQGGTLSDLPQGYRRHVQNLAVEKVKNGILTVDEYMKHFRR